MGRLIYRLNVSLDASLHGRRLYELMADYWPRGEEDPAATPAEREFSRLWKPLPN